MFQLDDDPQWYDPPEALAPCERCGEDTEALEPGPFGRRVCADCGSPVDVEAGDPQDVSDPSTGCP